MQESFDINDSIEGIWEKLGEWTDSLILSLPNFILAILVFVLFVIAAKYVGKLLGRILRFKVRQDSIREITIKIVKVLVIVLGFFVALGLLNLDTVLTSVLAGAGVVGLAIGLALQGTLNNTFSGILLSFLPEIQIGDWIENNGYAGRVVEINLRSIVIKEADNNYVVIPNSQVVDAPFKNFSRTSRSRVMLDCGVGYESDLELVKELTIKAISEHFPQKGNEEVEFMYKEFGDSSINFVVRFWTDVTSNREILLARSKAVIAVKKIYDENDINIPFPIRTLEFNNKLNIDRSSED
ncbi:small conductance mechanosensitive channel [Salinimicrobium catena]|uniref:Small conductance mechanosensitive channel n=1 Tax=Salinimicrobium catena TaxID=390640 RepID=A0A1H5LII3_9FLAO|nr:mechanosensitive ion channel family protein [Salinimicrobium catena]SDL10441.1 small conductance mechanosensitive channel [Salinimicrobium catena]SEE76845.1 small conductance mechanosensitive channel [Salinimicrobium catena]